MKKQEIADRIAEDVGMCYYPHRDELDGAGVTKKEIEENLKTQHFEKRVTEELEEYKNKL